MRMTWQAERKAAKKADAPAKEKGAHTGIHHLMHMCCAELQVPYKHCRLSHAQRRASAGSTGHCKMS